HRVENSYGEYIKFYRQPFADCFAAGLSVRTELTLPIFSINAGIGRNIIANGPDTRIFYQTLALKAYVWQGTFLQVGYQLSNFHLPNNLMLGVGYTFGRKL
ncbi:MAG: acyloxyacyl hydrolase, partial [Muribaculaceae bacterium]|nr:acyloxyacyl hydrolase [Muribaculaceae bacterium]